MSDVLVKVADSAVGRPGDTLRTFGLGSCVAVMLYDPRIPLGGMAHVLLPESKLARERENLAKFARTAVPDLVRRMIDDGAAREHLEARLVGGACMFANLMTGSSMNMGARNLAACREALTEAGIPIRGEAVGGDYGRSVRFVVETGKVIVTSALRDDVHL